MTARIALALAIHNHQPVGNFGWVIAEVFEHAYRPMVEALERHPTIRLSLHYTGPLLEWLRAEQPAFVERLVALVAREQVELLGGGWAEPVLASLPERDRVSQLRRMGDEIEALTGRRPRGAWLAERVWEPDLPSALVAGGYGWTILDDAHFRAAAIPEANLWGAYTTEDQGHLLTLFGTEQRLRYLIPFGDVDDVIAHLRTNATEDGTRVGVMGDDGEKFGGWPTTWEHCWGKRRWVDRFFEALEANADWLTTTTPSDWLGRAAPIGRAYIPTSSYAEMGEWALPPDEAVVFGDLLRGAVEAGRPEARWLRGAFWRNFQVRYREINDLHKQMLRASSGVDAMPAGPARDRATDHLHRGQSNDCYWHGLFGGVYISHMRLATHEHLIAAEDAADRSAGTFERAERVDLDLDGIDDVLLATEGQVVTIAPGDGAGIGAWDIRPVRHALGSVLRRRIEAYHERLRASELARAAAAERARVAAASKRAGGKRAAVADLAGAGKLVDPGSAAAGEVLTKEDGLAELLHVDRHERRSGLVHLLHPAATATEYATATARDLGDFVAGAWEIMELGPRRLVVARHGLVATAAGDVAVRAEKTIELDGGRLDPGLTIALRIDNLGDAPIDARLGLAFDTTMAGGGGNPAAYWEVGGEASSHDATRIAAGVEALRSGNRDIGLEMTTTMEPPADAWIAPLETVSNSESGFERVYQGSQLLLSWPLRLDPGRRLRVKVRNAIAATRDRAVEETT